MGCQACGVENLGGASYHTGQDHICCSCHKRALVWAAKQALAEERRCCEASSITLNIDAIVERSGGGYEINDGELRRVMSATDHNDAEEPMTIPDDHDLNKEPVSKLKDARTPIKHEPTGNPFIDKALGGSK